MQWLEGKKTYIGLMITLVGVVAQLIGPTAQPFAEDATGILGWLQLNWEVLTQGIGLIVAAYGRAVARVSYWRR